MPALSIFKPSITAITLALATLGVAQAQHHDGPRSRDEVRAEARAELWRPSIAKGEGPPMEMATVNGLTRAEVKAEAYDAVRDGDVAMGEGPTAVNSEGDRALTRAEVKREAADAVADGKVEKGPSPSATAALMTK